MKKIIAILCLCVMLVSAVACGKTEKSGLELIDFESGTLNIDTSKIVSYVKGYGHENVHFSFDVDKQIYSCEVFLSKEDSAKVEIDGEGYEDFISDARNFLINGTKVMSNVLKEYDLSGITCGMVLASDDGLVYCVAVDSVVTFVAHSNGDIVSVGDIENEIAKIAKGILGVNVEVIMNNEEKVVGVFYEGGDQTQASVQSAFDAVFEYMQQSGFAEYRLIVYGNEGQPFVESAVQGEQSPETSTDVSFDNVNYKYVGKTRTAYHVFEVVSTSDAASADGARAVSLLSQEIVDGKFAFYVVDSNEIFLGTGTKDGYTPFVYERHHESYTAPSFTTPFLYYFMKHFGSIDNAGYEYVERLDNGQGVTEYTFTINDVDPNKINEVKPAMQKIANLMSATLGENIRISLAAFVGTADEITVSAYIPPAETN